MKLVIAVKIGIISDTHSNKHPEKVMDFINHNLNDVDLIMHAGDYTNSKLIELIRRYKPFVGVWGNVDGTPVRHLLKEKEVLGISGYQIGLFHGHGTLRNSPLENAYQQFKADNVDIIVFGHNHQPTVQYKNGILMLNPGSLSRKRKEPWYTYIILNLGRDCFDAQVKFFKYLE